MGGAPPEELKRFFTRPNYPANLITLNGTLLNGLNAIFLNEMIALNRSLRESRQHLADNIVQGQGPRQASSGYWQLQPHEKDFEVHNDVTHNIRHLVGTAAAHTNLDAVRQQLQKERPPEKRSLEELVMAWLEPSATHNVSIGVLPKDSPGKAEVREAYHKLPKGSIVRQVWAPLRTLL